MAKTNLQIKAKNAATEASITTTLTYVNPNADSATLKSFAKKLNALTTNNYAEANRVQTINVDTEEVTNKTPGTLTIVDNPTVSNFTGAFTILKTDFSVNGEVPTEQTLFGYATNAGKSKAYDLKVKTTSVEFYSHDSQTIPPGEYTLYLIAPETDKYYAAYLTTTVSVPTA